MKAVTVVLSCLLVAGCLALPHSAFKAALREHERSAIVDMIMGLIEDIRADMIDNGMEPMEVEEVTYDLIDLGLANIIEGLVHAKDVIIHGLTTFRIENMNFALLTSTVTFDLYIDELKAIVDFLELTDGIVDGAAVSGKASGTVQVFNTHVNGRVRLSIGIITGISVRDVNFRLAIGGIKSDVVGEDVNGIGDRDINEFIETSATTIIQNHANAISAAINDIVMGVINNVL